MDNAVDWEQLEAVADGFSPEFLDILEELKVETPDLFSKLSMQIESSNLPEAAKVAHQLKGALANFGFALAAHLLKTVELKALEGARLEVIRQHVEEARLAYEQGLTALEEAANKRAIPS